MKIKYVVLSVMTLIINCDNHNVDKTSIHMKRIEADSDSSLIINQIRTVAEQYLKYDFLGARLSSDNIYYKSFVMMLSCDTCESVHENLWMVDTFKIGAINKTNNDNIYKVTVDFINALEITPVLEIISKEKIRSEIIAITNSKIINENELHISKKVVIDHFTILSQQNDWSNVRKGRLLEIISTKFK